MSDEIDALELKIEKLRKKGESILSADQGALNRALIALAASQKRQFEASLARRAALLKKKGRGR